MRVLRALLGSLTWLLALLTGLLGVILCVTIILIPLGILVLRLSRSLVRTSMRLVLPRAVTHPVEELKDTGRKQRRRFKHTVKDVGKKGHKLPGRRRKWKFG